MRSNEFPEIMQKPSFRDVPAQKLKRVNNDSTETLRVRAARAMLRESN